MATNGQQADYRQYLPDLSSERFQRASKQDPYEYAEYFASHQAPPWLFQLTEQWKKLYAEPFKGVTADGDYFQTWFKNLS